MGVKGVVCLAGDPGVPHLGGNGQNLVEVPGGVLLSVPFNKSSGGVTIVRELQTNSMIQHDADESPLDLVITPTLSLGEEQEFLRSLPGFLAKLVFRHDGLEGADISQVEEERGGKLLGQKSRDRDGMSLLVLGLVVHKVQGYCVWEEEEEIVSSSILEYKTFGRKGTMSDRENSLR